MRNGDGGQGYGGGIAGWSGCSGDGSGTSVSSETFGIVGDESGMGYCEFCGLRSCASIKSRVVWFETLSVSVGG